MRRTTRPAARATPTGRRHLTLTELCGELGKLAESFRSKLTTATREGVAFDPRSGFPEPEARQLLSVSWYEHAREFVAMKWPEAAPRSRRSIAEALATVTPVLTRDGRGRPSVTELRRVLYQWSFTVGTYADDETNAGHEWLTANSLSLIDLQNPAIVRQCLDTIATTLDGRPAAQTTVARKRAIFYGALRYAVELGRLQSHPIDHVQWRAPRRTDELDRRVVINPTQAVRLLAAVRKMIRPWRRSSPACTSSNATRGGPPPASRPLHAAAERLGPVAAHRVNATRRPDMGRRLVPDGRPRAETPITESHSTSPRLPCTGGHPPQPPHHLRNRSRWSALRNPHG
jgi:hypothetical protein